MLVAKKPKNLTSEEQVSRQEIEKASKQIAKKLTTTEERRPAGKDPEFRKIRRQECMQADCKSECKEEYRK